MVAASKSLMSLCAADIMSRNIVMIPRQMSLQGAARMLSRAGVTGAPIIDDKGCCIGVLSTTDFMHSVETDHHPRHKPNGKVDAIFQSWQIPEGNLEPRCCVEEYMTKDPVLVAPGTPIGELARIMMDAHIHRIIVVDMATHRPLGIVSSMDILAAVARVDQSSKGHEKRQGYEGPVGALS
jgi:predicted transcriptional regulator